MDKILGIVISKNYYKNNYYILNILNENSIFSAKYLEKKNNSLKNIDYFSYGEFLLYKGNINQYKVKEFDSLFSVNYDNRNFEELFFIDFLKEILNKILLIDEDINKKELFLLLKKTLINFNNVDINCTSGNIFLSILVFFYNILLILGININSLSNKDIFTKIDNNIRIAKDSCFTISKDEFIKIFIELCDIFTLNTDIVINSKENLILL